MLSLIEQADNCAKLADLVEALPDSDYSHPRITAPAERARHGVASVGGG